jgi:predicted AlkP superfamily phosphohydrolase/phosphomutase
MRDIHQGKMKSALYKILEAVERKGDHAKYLIQMENWDLFIMVFGETDLVGHHFWKYHDSNSPFYERSIPEVNDAVKAVYRTIDRKIGEMLNLFPSDTSVMIVSDHGFGGNNDVVIHLNNMLEDMGFLKFKSSFSIERIIVSLLYKAKRTGLRLTPSAIKKQLIKKQRTGIVNKMESWLRFSLLDWSQTTAYSEESPYFPSIWINLKGREPAGIVSPGVEYEEVREAIMNRLSVLRDPYTGSLMINAVYKRDEIYTGPYVEKAPDIIIDWDNPNGYSYIMSGSSSNSKNRSSMRRLTNEEMKADKVANNSGNHRQYGIFIARGEVFKKDGLITGAEIIDIAPTALYIQGMPIPTVMDGKILTQAISPQFLANQKPIFSEDAEGDKEKTIPYTEEESEIIRKRLKDLGYLE